MPARKKVAVVGAGMSGLVAALYLQRAGHAVTLIEKTAACGGLVGSFWREGFLFDTGPRAIGNAGILEPMLADLGIELPLVPGLVSLGMGGEIIHFDARDPVADYLAALGRLFPEPRRELRRIGRRIRSAVRMAQLMNRMPNPFFTCILGDPGLVFGRFLPLMPGFLAALLRTAWADRPIEAALAALSGHPALNDLLSQHFFKATPASFAFGYCANFQDYRYPLGGSARLPEALAERFRSHGGELRLETEIVAVHAAERRLVDREGRVYDYDGLLWCADLKSLYEKTLTAGVAPRAKRRWAAEAERYGACRAGESVFSLFLAVDEAPERFAAVSRGHFIYTPRTEGLGGLQHGGLERAKAAVLRGDQAAFLEWLSAFCRLNSYEISLPALKDPRLAPPGKTGLAVSLLFDGELCRLVEQAGWYGEFKNRMADGMIDALASSVYPWLRERLLFWEAASPRSLRERFGNSEGAITGWSMEGRVPVPRHLGGIGRAPATALPGVRKAGQWSYSPAGVPVAILSARVAAASLSRELFRTGSSAGPGR